MPALRPYFAAALATFAPIAAGQDGATVTVPVEHYTLPAPIPARRDVPDVPPPPRAAFVTPYKSGMPEVPVGPHSWDVPPGAPLVPGQGSASPAMAPVAIYRNSLIRPAGAGWGTVGEPTVSKLSNVNGYLHTGNWYGANSTNGGSTWSYINPYTIFGAVDGGFCCDQATIAHQGQQLTIWLLQFGFSATSNRGSIMLGVGADTPGISGGYRIDPGMVGFPAGNWFDFPHLAVSNAHVFVASNVFNAAGQYQGAVVMRLSATQLRAGTGVGIGVTRSDASTPPASTFGSARFALGMDGSTPTMFWATHVNTTTIRIFAWPDSGPVTVRDRAIGTWYGGTTPAPGPDSRDWTARADNRIGGGFQGAQGTFGWAWHSNAGGSFPRNFTRLVRFDGNFALHGEATYWNPTIAYMYPALAPSEHGHLGMTLCGGGGTWHPHTVALIMDDQDGFGGGDNIVAAGGNSGPATSIWGDYTWAQYIRGNKWVGTGLAQVGGPANANSEHRNFDFGRQDLTTPVLSRLTLQSTPVTGVPFTMNVVSDFNLLRNGTTNATRVFRDNTALQISVPATFGSRQFHRWILNGAPQSPGQNTLSWNFLFDTTIVAQYGTYTAGTFASLGTGCPGSNGVPAQAAGATLPELGQRPTYSLSNGARNSGAILVLGFSITAWGAIPLPLRVPGTTCDLRTDLVVTLSTATNASGQASMQLTVPNDLSLLGSSYYTQWWSVDLFINPYSLTMSNAIASRIGGWNFN